MHDRIFEKQPEWTTVSLEQARAMFVRYANDIGLDVERFSADLERGTYRDKVDASYQEAAELGLPGTPTFFVNATLFQAPLSYFYLDAFVQLELLAQNQYEGRPEMVIDPDKEYQATIKTEKGDIVIALDSENAPITVNNFVFLAREGWYDDLTFFRVIPGFVAQAGDPTNTGLGGPGYELPAEISLTHEPGAIAMARRSDQVNPERLSSGSQFYIALDALPQLDDAYTVFGYIVEGMDVAQAITKRDPAQVQDPSMLPPGDKILTIEIEEIE